jgi:hypothetical protein
LSTKWRRDNGEKENITAMDAKERKEIDLQRAQRKKRRLNREDAKT